MKRLLFLILVTLFISCGFSQSINKEVVDDNGKTKLLGLINKDGLTKAPFSDWFNKNYNEYDVNNKVVDKLKDSLTNYTIKVFLGTWCGDSKKEVPRFYSILEAANFPKNQLEVIALDKTSEAYKQSPNGEEKGMNIHRVPTFIFYKNGKEVNRIVEHPKETLERDIEKIVTNKRYTPNYVIANYLQLLLSEKSIDELKSLESHFIPDFANHLKGYSELNTLGYVYLRANALDKSQYLFLLNTKIFPYNYAVYDSLAEFYFETKDYTEALKNYYKVLSLDPQNKNALKMIEEIKLILKQII